MKHRISFRIPLMIALVCVIMSIILDLELRPVLKESAKIEAANVYTDIFNQSIEQIQKEKGNNFYNINKDLNGKIQNVEFDTYNVNLFKTELVKMIREKSEENKTVRVRLNLSNAFDISPLSMDWPEYTVHLTAPTKVNIELKTDFSDAGINQTLQTVKLHLKADVFIVFPGERIFTTYEYEYLICENLIVGDTPSSFYGDRG